MSPTNYHRTPQRKKKVREYNASPRGKYQANKLNARTRGVPFLLTFEEWWEIWEPQWNNRGRGRGKYHLCRKNDTGAYVKGNVYLGKHEHNCTRDKPPLVGKQGTPIPQKAIWHLANLFAEGKSISQAAKIVGCNFHTGQKYIQQILKQLMKESNDVIGL